MAKRSSVIDQTAINLYATHLDLQEERRQRKNNRARRAQKENETMAKIPISRMRDLLESALNAGRSVQLEEDETVERGQLRSFNQNRQSVGLSAGVIFKAHPETAAMIADDSYDDSPSDPPPEREPDWPPRASEDYGTSAPDAGPPPDTNQEGLASDGPGIAPGHHLETLPDGAQTLRRDDPSPEGLTDA